MSTFRNYGFVKTKIEYDLDLQDETFIQNDEMVGYANEGLKECFGEILGLRQNYFLSKWFVPCVAGNDLFILPPNIYANKVRGVIYQNGSIIYTMKQLREKNLFENIAYVNQYGLSDEYRYLIRNDIPGVPCMQIVPPSRETAVFPPTANPFLPMLVYYIREHNRVPLTGEYYFTEVINPAAISSGNLITVAAGTGVQAAVLTGTSAPGTAYWPYVTSPIAYVTGDQVQLQPNPYVAGSVLPGGLVAGQTYYVIAQSSTTIQLATSLVNALAGNYIPFSTSGTGLFNLSVAGTAAQQNATLLDIPEFYEFIMQWMKVRCVEKEGDPRYEAMVAELQSQRKMMVDSLTEMIEDNDTEIQGDYAHYLELS
jgi:hypothetical protein